MEKLLAVSNQRICHSERSEESQVCIPTDRHFPLRTSHHYSWQGKSLMRRGLQARNSKLETIPALPPPHNLGIGAALLVIAVGDVHIHVEVLEQGHPRIQFNG